MSSETLQKLNSYLFLRVRLKLGPHMSGPAQEAPQPAAMQRADTDPACVDDDESGQSDEGNSLPNISEKEEPPANPPPANFERRHSEWAREHRI